MTDIKHVISHDNCPDGIASAMIAASKYPHAIVEFVNYNTPAWSNLPAREGTLFVDMSPPPARVQEFIAVGARVLDHHVTAAELVRSMPNGTYDPDACGALLAHREVEGTGPTPRFMAKRFAQLADVRDRWLKGSDDWHSACAQAAALMFYERDTLLQQARTGTPWLTAEQMHVGHVLEDKRKRDAISAADKAIPCDVRGMRLAFVNDTAGIISDAAETLRGRGVNLVVGFRLALGSNGATRCDYSLRSDDSFDCAAFCKINGGGGHARAAGFNAVTGDPIGKFLSLYGVT